MSFSDQDWRRLGRAIYQERVRKGFADTSKWSTHVGRSSRVLLGLERGEPVGKGTLMLVAQRLGWDLDDPFRILSGADGGQTVGRVEDDADFGTIKARKPAGMSDEDFKRLLNEYREEIEWKLDRAARDRDQR